MKTQPSQIIVVADKSRDIQAAKKLGCKSIAVSSKLEIDGDFKLTNIKEILKILEGD